MALLSHLSLAFPAWLSPGQSTLRCPGHRLPRTKYVKTCQNSIEASKNTVASNIFKPSQQPKLYDQQKEQNEPQDDSSRMQTVHMSMFSRASKHSNRQRIRETSTVFQWPSHSPEHCSLGSWDLANQAHHSNSKHVNSKISKDCVGRRMRIKSTQFRMANGPLPHFVRFLQWPDRLLRLSYFHRWPQRNIT